MEGKLIKVIYLHTNQLDEGFLTKLDIDEPGILAIEIYSGGETRYVLARNGITDYILNGGPNTTTKGSQ